jgi:hypothetical protein
MRGKKMAGSLLAALFILPALMMADGSFLKPFQRMLILENGRQKPVDTFARNMLKQFSGRSTLSGQEASAWLARIFKLSLAFKTFDQNARTYGQIIYSSLLNLGETMGVEEYSKVIAVQDPEVRQRIRDFLYYPTTLLSQKARAESDKQTREDYPTLFPKDYQFGQNDPLFKQ